MQQKSVVQSRDWKIRIVEDTIPGEDVQLRRLCWPVF